MQNESLKVVDLIRSQSYFTIMADETTDVSNWEQFVICLRWVDNDFQVHEDFVGLYEVSSANADTIQSVIMDVLQRLNLSISRVRGQFYDGAAAMAGVHSGVAARICRIEK